MSKKFTTILVLVALWLAIPAQAQTFEAKKAAKQQVFNANKALKAENFATAKHKAELAKVKATDQPVGIAFRGGKHTCQVDNLLKDAFTNVQKEKDALEKFMSRSLDAVMTVEKASRFNVALEKNGKFNAVKNFSGRQVLPSKVAQGIMPVSGAMFAKKSANKAPLKAANVEELVGDFMLLSSNYDYDQNAGGLVEGVPAAGGRPVSITKVDDATIAISGFTSGATEDIIATVDLENSTISIANEQKLQDTSYGTVVLENASSEGPIEGTIYEDGAIVLNAIWYTALADGDYAGYMWDDFYYASWIDSANGTMTWAKGEEANVADVYIVQDPASPKTVTVYNFGNQETAIDVTLKPNCSIVIESQYVFYGGSSYGDFYTYAYDGEYTSPTIYGLGTSNTLTFDSQWTIYAPKTGYWLGVLEPATITLSEGEFAYPVIADVAATPANPEVLGVSPYNATKGYGYVMADIPAVDAEGEDLLEDKLYYQFYSDVDGDIQPITFPADAYLALTEDLSIIPYTLNDAYDFDVYMGCKVVYLNFPFDYDRIGVKSIYLGGGETNETEIQWLQLKTKPASIPFATDFSTEESLDNFIILDANDDGKTWSWSSSNGAFYKYNSANSADDYLILPVQLVAGKTYDLALTAASSVSYPEKFEVVIGKEASATGLSTVIIPETEIASSDKLDYKSSFSVDEDGVFYVAIHAISEADMNLLKIFSLSIELGAEPTAPAAVTDLAVVAGDNKLEATVSFKAPSKTVAGEDLTANLTKIEILRDGAVIKTLEDVAPGSEQSYVDNDPTLTSGTYTYQVIPYNASGIGIKSAEVPVFISAAVDVPYVADFTQEGVIDMFQAIDANNDGKTWSWSAKYGAFYSYAADAADDYLVSLPLNLEAGKNYNVLVSALAYGGAGYPEAFEVKVGKAVDALNITAIPATTVTNEEYDDFEGTFTVAETGTYVVAIHAISEADMWRLQVGKLSVEIGADPAAPAAVSDLAVKAGAEGANEATISFTAPAKAVSGADLTDNLTKIEILRNDSLVNTIENVAAGSAQSWTETDLEGGQVYTYQVIPYNANGRGLKSEKVSTYVGVDTPADLEELDAFDKGTSLAFSWKKVGNVGQNGGFVDSTKVNYEVWSLKVVESLFGSYLDFDEQLGNVVNDDNFDYTFNTDEGDQGYKYWGVVPVNEVGQGGALAVTTLVGAAYTLPVIEGFSGPAFHYVWEYADNSEVFVSEESSDDDKVALILTAMDEPGTAWFNSGKIDLKTAANPTLLFDVKSATIKNVNIIGSVNGEELTTISTAAVDTSYTTVMVPLNSLQNGRYAQVGFSADFATPTIEDIDWSTFQYVYTWGDLLTFDNIRIVDLYEHDVQVALNAPASVVAGNTAKLQVKLSNNAQNSANGFTLKLSANDKVFYDKTFDAIIPAFSSIEMEMEYETSIFDEAGDVTLTAEVIYGNDLNPNNNTDEAIITVKESGLPAPTNLVAENKGEAGVDLAWTAPEIGAVVPEAVTIDFESEDDLSQFTQIDADGDGFIWNQHINTGSGNLSVHGDGVGSIYSESYYNDTKTALTPDNWLVTPRAVLNGTFSFWACGQDANYAAEHFAVFVSTTVADDPAAFTQVSEEFIATGEMTEYTVDLSSYAGAEGYIAIRHFNVTDQFYLVVDDISFISTGSSTPAPVKFNIYVGRDKIADVEGDKTTYTVAADELTPGEYTFGVSAVYPNGLESKAAVAKITIVTSINDIVANGKAVDVYSLDGKLVRRQVKSFDGLKGVYVINGKAVMVK